VTGALKQLARAGLHRWGGLRPILWKSRRNFRILTYHRFSPTLYPSVRADLERQCAFLARHFQMVPLAEIGRAMETGKQLPPNALTVTIDDGYRDFFAEAFPVFNAWGVPATVFLITDFIDGKLWPWWNQVEYAVEHSRAATVRLPIFQDTPGQDSPPELFRRTEEERIRTTSVICGKLVRVPNQVRLDFLRMLPELFQVDIPSHAPAEFAALTWDEIRSMREVGVEFGAHTKTHPVLTNVEDTDSIHEEVAGSKARIETELKCATLHFCYPNGDFHEAALEAVERCGFQTAVTTQPGMNRRGAHRYRLKRFSVEPNLSDYYFREEVAGMHV
jgi:peptidoglycan/xylan/chitin deacetylase (PgdA/CDA1 family)